MNLKNVFIYNLNNDLNKEFFVLKDHRFDNFVVISNFDDIQNSWIVDLLSRDRKIIFADETVISTQKLKKLFMLINDRNPELAKSLFISRECFIKTSADLDYYEILESLKLKNDFNENSVIEADAKMGTGIKINDLITRQIFQKLRQSLLTKNILFNHFNLPTVKVDSLVCEVLETVRTIAANLIPSVNIFFENQNGDKKYFVNFIGTKTLSFFEDFNFHKIGVVNTIDKSDSIIAEIDSETKNLLNINLDKCGWIDLIKVKETVQKLGIDEIVLDNINVYNNIETIQVCSEYKINEKITCQTVKDTSNKQIKAGYSIFKGWDLDLDLIEDANLVPKEVIFFLAEIKKILNVQTISTKTNHFEIKI